MIFPKAQVTCTNYISYFVSKYNAWFRFLGYPELDILKYEDGEWAIIQFLNKPVIPCLTKWNFVLSGMRNVEISPMICKKYTEQLDLEKRYIWDQEEKRQEQIKRQIEEEDRRSLDLAEKGHKVISKNKNLMERVAKNGIEEISLRKIYKHIPNYRW